MTFPRLLLIATAVTAATLGLKFLLRFGAGSDIIQGNETNHVMIWFILAVVCLSLGSSAKTRQRALSEIELERQANENADSPPK